ncbi:mgtE: magnesium transporter (plasmid) [Rubrobacter radiotolerans]|uniref:Magnesium transporter MgtE n=1 Tax=Rubrobacter radiotolerans TaxID=42256 RepID=A0A023X7K7_RUBRA|nr:magnesium transporter [Rubrobacter radiotolerans]AHY48318.1 mgtE: magnesium transporter [Rubrobacter radiotolerans]MDX5895591.1 magnesium transporter [Rubrobacter radiotolerans]SMC01515.1 magnesium transporter [Rubrobacter radiotolerans DSM 5868]
MERRQIDRNEVEAMISARRWRALKERLSGSAAPEVAELLLDLDKPDRVLLFRALGRELSTEVFAYLKPETQNALLRELTDEETRRLLTDMSPDDRTPLLEELPGQASQKLLNLLSPEDRARAQQLLGYPEESVGRLMTPDYVAVRPDWTVGEALAHIRRLGIDRETINWVYVVDGSWKLLDALTLRTFIVTDPQRTVEEVMDRRFVAVSAFADREEAVREIQRHDLEAVPVVDSDGVLVGIVTVDDVLDVAEREATEDFHLYAAVRPLDASYRESGVYPLFLKRVPWLVLLVLVGLVSSGVIEAFEETLAAAVALAFFIPLLIDSGGNTGSQSATLMVRAIATGDLKLSQWGRALGKELLVGATLGVALGLAAAGLGIFRGGPEIGLIVGLTMIAIVLTANMIGAALPFALSKLRLDPAVASAPLITTVVDATGLLIYFTIATLVLGLA